MPEGLEVEIYRRAAVGLIGRTVRDVEVDALVARPLAPAAVAAALRGVAVHDTRRIGKQLLVVTDGPVIGLHFGMTGRIVVDADAPIRALEYGSGRDEARWDRVRIQMTDGGSLRVNDPRRWARLVLDPDISALGPDLFSVTRAELAGALAPTASAVKAALLDQRRVAGLGNLCVDEVLWHASVAPSRPARTLSGSEIDRLHGAMRARLPTMLELGGSHRGTISPAVRAALPGCPRDGTPMIRDRVGGRTTVWCPGHQA